MDDGNNAGERQVVFGSRVSEANPVLDALIQSPDWGRATKVIKVMAWRCGAGGLLADVVAETQSVLMEEVATGRKVKNLCAYAGQVARSVVRLWRDQVTASGVDVDSVACSPRLASFDQLAARRGLPLKFLRGATQQKLVAAVRAGVGVEAIAEALGMEVWEVRRQLERLASRICARRRKLAKLRRESPDSDST